MPQDILKYEKGQPVFYLTYKGGWAEGEIIQVGKGQPDIEQYPVKNKLGAAVWRTDNRLKPRYA